MQAQVFIIESLDFEDETDEDFEGKIICNILKMNRKQPIYFYIRTKKELEEVLDKFEDSQYRYLHISCHGSRNSMSTTLDQIPIQEFGKLVSNYLSDKRLFISACSLVNGRLAKSVFDSSACYSMVGPSKDVNFSDAAILWASFYHNIFRIDESKMKRKDIEDQLEKSSKMFDVDLAFYFPGGQKLFKRNFDSSGKSKIRSIKLI